MDDTDIIIYGVAILFALATAGAVWAVGSLFTLSILSAYFFMKTWGVASVVVCGIVWLCVKWSNEKRGSWM